MFNGVPDQFHQFIASRTPVPIPLSFPIHGSTSSSSSSPPPFPSFDPYPQSHLLLHHHHQHQLHHHQPPPSAAPSSKNNEETQDDKEEAAAADYGLLSTKLELEPMDPWSNDEVLALLRIRSSLENWFPDFTWEHVSRKLAELGFKRSAENCKEKFEEESRNFGRGGGDIQLFHKNYRLFGELEEFCHGENNSQLSAEKNQSAERPIDGEEEEEEEEDSRNVAEGNNEPQGKEEMAKESKKGRKRKRKKHRFEMFMGFCEAIVSKMMTQQEELHSKLLDDMVKRDEENIAREEAWKRQEMDRINKEIEIREQEQAMSCDRQAKIIEFLKKFSSTNNSSSSSDNTKLWFAEKIDGLQTTKISNPTMVLTQQNPSSLLITHNNLTTHSPSTEALFSSPSSLLNSNRKSPTQLPSRLNSLTSGLPETEDVQLDYKLVDSSSTETLSPQNTLTSTPDAITSKEPTTRATPSHEPNNSINSHPISSPQKPIENPSRHDRDDIGKRWPRDEVLALVNLRCSLYNNNEEKEGGGANGNNNKGPLWERISQGMMELGYKRSAKRCKEKWENINKYFRKTKDVKKKRSLDSRTCPYFQQLSSLYGQGTHLAAPSDAPENHPSLPGNCSAMPETAQGGSSSEANADAAEGEKDTIQVPAFNF